MKKQRNLHDFFTPKGRKRKKTGGDDEEEDQTDARSPSKSSQKKRRETPTASNVERSASPSVIWLDSDDESSDNFTTPKSSLGTMRDRGKGKGSCKQTDSSPISTPQSGKMENVKRKRLLDLEDHSEESPQQASGPSSEPHKGNQWSCDACTFLNHEALKACEICFTPKKVVKKTIARSNAPSLNLQSANSRLSGKTHFGVDIVESDSASQSQITEESVDQNGTQDDIVNHNSSDSSDSIMDDFDEPGSSWEPSANTKTPGKRTPSQGSSLSRPSPMKSPTGGCSQTSTQSELEEEEAAAADILFSQKSKSGTGDSWTCGRCGAVNRPADFLCDGCLSDRPPQNPQDEEGNQCILYDV